LLITHDTGGIKAGKVERASRLELTTIEGEWVEEQSLGNSRGRGVGCVVVQGYGGVVGVSKLEVGDIVPLSELSLYRREISRAELSRGQYLMGWLKLSSASWNGRDRF